MRVTSSSKRKKAKDGQASYLGSLRQEKLLRSHTQRFLRRGLEILTQRRGGAERRGLSRRHSERTLTRSAPYLTFPRRTGEGIWAFGLSAQIPVPSPAMRGR